jgi:hypothetical protein
MWRHVDLSHSTIFHFVTILLSNFFYIFLSYGSMRLLLTYYKGLLSFHALSAINHILFSNSVHSTYLHIFTSCTSITFLPLGLFISPRFRFHVNTLYFQLSLVLYYNVHSSLKLPLLDVSAILTSLGTHKLRNSAGTLTVLIVLLCFSQSQW